MPTYSGFGVRGSSSVVLLWSIRVLSHFQASTLYEQTWDVTHHGSSPIYGTSHELWIDLSDLKRLWIVRAWMASTSGEQVEQEELEKPLPSFMLQVWEHFDFLMNKLIMIYIKPIQSDISGGVDISVWWSPAVVKYIVLIQQRSIIGVYLRSALSFNK